MKISERLKNVRQLFVDTAPVIYFVENNPRYADIVRVVFDSLDLGNGVLVGVTSPITLAECLVLPYRTQQPQVVEAFTELLANSDSIRFVTLDGQIANRAADLRARYGLSLPDAFQIAVAILSGCDAFLTNDISLRQVVEINVILLDEMEVG
jgi:predicted nucleic acid-binding protein